MLAASLSPPHLIVNTRITSQGNGMPDASVFPREETNANLAARPSLRSAHARQESRLHLRGCTDAGAGDWSQCRDFQCSELAASASGGNIARGATGRHSGAVRKAQPKEHCGVGA